MLINTQYGDVNSFGEYPEYQKQLSKFGYVQDRLREWRPSVLDRIKLFSCITINMLDIDGFRIDKGLTITPDAQAEWSAYIRDCAAAVGKKNFFIPGEIVSANPEGMIWLGRGKEPQMVLQDVETAMNATNGTDQELWVREAGYSAVDAAVFHYSIYRNLCRFLALDGIYAALNDISLNWASAWANITTSNDLVNVNTGEWDPRHLYGVTNQDVFRWPAIQNGTMKNVAGLFVTTLIMPGIPILVWGEEQSMYVLDNTAGNYVYGRGPMNSAIAWQAHGCYSVGSTKYANFPLEAALTGCHDDGVGKDQFNPAHPVRNIIKRMYELRDQFPTLNDGFTLTQTGNLTYEWYQPGSGGTPTEMGVWSMIRAGTAYQNLSSNQTVWLVFGNENKTVTYTSKNGNASLSLNSPFDSGTVVRNLFYPYETYTVAEQSDTSTGYSGMLESITLAPWGYKALVPTADWVAPTPVITSFSPGHDARLLSNTTQDGTETVAIELGFSQAMDCDSVTSAISIESNTVDGSKPSLDSSSISCKTLDTPLNVTDVSGGVPTVWTFSANLVDTANGVHSLIVKNASSSSGNTTTGSRDHFLMRIGQANNPIVFTKSNYSTTLLRKDDSGNYYVNHAANGATKFRYTLDWFSSWSDWYDYDGSNTTLASLNWTGTSKQAWDGQHVVVQYWSNLTSSSNHYQGGDYDRDIPRQWPHMYVQGPFNQYSYDTGLPGEMKQASNGTWSYDFMYEWPTKFQLNLWGVNPDGRPDQTVIYGDVDGDSVLDRLPPGSLMSDVVNVTDSPPAPHVAWRISANDGSLNYWLTPIGNQYTQLAMFILLAVIPLVTGALVIWLFMRLFYHVKFNEIGVSTKQALIPLAVRRKFKKGAVMMNEKGLSSMVDFHKKPADIEPDPLAADAGGHRRAVLIATMEYDIEDWAIKIKIGGLGVMAQLMGKNLGHMDLIWVVPCVDGVDYPIDQIAESMSIIVFDKEYEIQVQYHTLRNITYVLLDAPIFRKQSKSEPYPARMDDLESAIYYSAWNQCIAQACERFNVDLYHVNDYHGAIAPLYLLPRVIPICLSLHNAEFQGLWPMRSNKEREEVCRVFNLDPVIAQKYVQFGEVFNLLHAAASYLRVHQKGFGAVGVSRKYGKRSFARYPIFWGLSKIGSLPNPDPTDTAEWDRNATQDPNAVVVNEEFEAKRPEQKRQAQAWAGLDEDPDAELFVFVGRWSMQKGVDLIADVFPSILEQYPKVQLICVGPVIDLYGRFAALKLDKMMSLYPGRVYSKPEFTALPPYIFSGSEFALIPSRDEPFGLVAVEFGRKGALGVGARVGGLGQMPGWWYTVESMTPKHLVHQFKMAIHEALASSEKTRRIMRARSAVQRFPVAQWAEDLDTLQVTSIKVSKEQSHEKSLSSPSMTNLRTLFTGHSTTSLTDFHSTREKHGSTLAPPGTPGTPGAGPWTPTGGMPSPRLSPSGRSYSGAFSTLNSPTVDDILLPPPITPAAQRESMASRFSTLSYDSVTEGKSDYALNKVDPSFTDASGQYLREFEKKLEYLGTKGAKSSENLLCIEENLIKSEKKYFNSYREAKLGHPKSLGDTGSRPGSIFNMSRSSTPRPGTPQTQGEGGSFFEHSQHGSVDSMTNENLLQEEFPLGADYKPPTGLARWLLYRVGDWPIYTIILAFGQIIAANSYQITLLIGEIGETATQLYVVASIYAVGSMLWWLVFRRLKSVYVLSLPFVFYGLAFFLIAFAPFAGSVARGWVQNVATGSYAVASSSGSLFFALNFGDEGKQFFNFCPISCFHPMLTFLRWCSNQVMGLPRLYRPRHTATVHRSALVLGFLARRALQHRCSRHINRTPGQCHYRHHPSSGNCHVGSRCHPLCRTPTLLPQRTRQSALILPLHIPTQDHHLVLCCRHHPELLDVGPVRKKLEVPLDHQQSACLGHPAARHTLLRHHLGRYSLRLQSPLQITFLDPPCLCHRSRRSSMVPNALGHIRHGRIHPLGRRRRLFRTARALHMAVARHARFTTGCGFWYDLAANNDEIPHLLYAHGGAGAGIHCDHLGKIDGAG